MAMGLGLGLGLSRGGAAAAVPIVLGNELVQNGNFSSSTGYTLTTPGDGTVTISGGTLNFSATTFGANAATTASETLTAGTYRVTFTVISRNSGTIRPIIGGANGTPRAGVGVFSEDLVITATDQILKLSGPASPTEADFVIDDFSVKRIN